MTNERETILSPKPYRKCPRCGGMIMDPYPGLCMNCVLLAMKKKGSLAEERNPWNPSERDK